MDAKLEEMAQAVQQRSLAASGRALQLFQGSAEFPTGLRLPPKYRVPPPNHSAGVKAPIRHGQSLPCVFRHYRAANGVILTSVFSS
jgi:hypothetical protein